MKAEKCVEADLEISRNMAIEAGQPITGYPSLAAFIASDQRGHRTSIFGRFEELAARNLLTLQSQLAELEALQRRYDFEDLGSQQATPKERCRDRGKLEAAAIGGDVEAQARVELAHRVQTKVAEYRKSIGCDSRSNDSYLPSRRRVDSSVKYLVNAASKRA